MTILFIFSLGKLQLEMLKQPLLHLPLERKHQLQRKKALLKRRVPQRRRQSVWERPQLKRSLQSVSIQFLLKYLNNPNILILF